MNGAGSTRVVLKRVISSHHGAFSANARKLSARDDVAASMARAFRFVAIGALGLVVVLAPGFVLAVCLPICYAGVGDRHVGDRLASG